MNSNKKFVGLMSQEEEAEKLQNTLISGARKEGIAEGIEQGIERGIAEGTRQNKIEIAKNMLNENIDIQIITKVTGLTEKEIETLK